MPLSKEDFAKIRSLYNNLSKEDQDYIQNNLSPDKRLKFASIINEKTKSSNGLDLLLSRAGLTPQKLKDNLDAFEVSQRNQTNIPIQSNESALPGTTNPISALADVGKNAVGAIENPLLHAVDRNPDSLLAKGAAVAIPTLAKTVIPETPFGVALTMAGLASGRLAGKASEGMAEFASNREQMRNLPEKLLDAYRTVRKTLGDNIEKMRETILRDPSADEKIFNIQPALEKITDAMNFKEVGVESGKLKKLADTLGTSKELNTIRKELAEATKDNDLGKIASLRSELNDEVKSLSEKTPRELLEFLDKAKTISGGSGSVYKNAIEPIRDELAKVYPDYVSSLRNMRGMFQDLENTGLDRKLTSIGGTQRIVDLARTGKLKPREVAGLENLEKASSVLNDPITFTQDLKKAQSLAVIRRNIPTGGTLDSILRLGVDLPADLAEALAKKVSGQVTPLAVQGPLLSSPGVLNPSNTSQ